MTHIYGIDAAGQDALAKASHIAREVAAAHAADVDQKGRFPSEAMAALAQAGLMGLTVPAELGGMGQGMRAFAAVAEELATACASTAMIYVMHNAALQTIVATKTLAGRDALLRDIASGKHLTTLAFSEVGTRSNFWFQGSELAPAGEGYTVTGHKSWVTSSLHAQSYVALSRRPGAANAGDLTMYLVRNGQPGMAVRGGFDGLGLRGNESGPVLFDGYRISEGDLISPHGAGNDVSLGVVLPWFNVGTSAMAHGLCRAALSATTTHLVGAGFDFNGSKLRDLPNLRTRLAEMAVATEKSRALLGYTFTVLESASEAAPLYVLEVRYSAVNAATEVTDLAMKACGGAAFRKELGVERAFRDARAGWVMAPTSDALADFIGKALTGLPLL